MIQQRWFHEKSHEEYPPDSQHPRIVPGEVVLQYRSKSVRSPSQMQLMNNHPTWQPEPDAWTEWTPTPHVYEKADER